jgi:hypothetical protein
MSLCDLLRSTAFIVTEFLLLYPIPGTKTGGIIMNKAQKARFNSMYQQHVNALKRQGKSPKTTAVYTQLTEPAAQNTNRIPIRGAWRFIPMCTSSFPAVVSCAPGSSGKNLAAGICLRTFYGWCFSMLCPGAFVGFGTLAFYTAML